MVIVRCAKCGKSFALKYEDRRVKLCRECAKKKNEEVEKETAKCKYCGATFVKKRKTQVFCSDFCRNEAYREKYQSEHEIKTLICPWCHKTFRTTDTTRKYCSKDCYMKAKKWRDKQSAERKKKSVPE